MSGRARACPWFREPRERYDQATAGELRRLRAEAERLAYYRSPNAGVVVLAYHLGPSHGPPLFRETCQ